MQWGMLVHFTNTLWKTAATTTTSTTNVGRPTAHAAVRIFFFLDGYTVSFELDFNDRTMVTMMTTAIKTTTTTTTTTKL